MSRSFTLARQLALLDNDANRVSQGSLKAVAQLAWHRGNWIRSVTRSQVANSQDSRSKNRLAVESTDAVRDVFCYRAVKRAEHDLEIADDIGGAHH